ncbi:lysophospholipid transporter LplT [Paucibacter sp. KBW04]|uniref:lysophospholipid transporter LplT n=1 Tax=Paucibacter sp. KBW04 TaxID=2153361 RepID=UPI000F57BC5A|nr:lysophospholipid transporter LplT [Paucibacter sp. KBW04]RQO61813.1 lysophospholipid transporter LplT [Paucibacter sp. KBW04]
MPPGFHLLIAAQFASALADNALLIVSIALLQEQGSPAWWAPLLKFGFTIAYVLLAPFVGPLADAVPKARLMAWMNGVKLLGLAALALGVAPMLAFTLIGFGAAAYAPAKYGLVTEMVAAKDLVRANSWLEVSVVGAALLGVVLGGVLVSPWLLQTDLWIKLAQAMSQGSQLSGSLLALSLVYALASMLNLGIPDSGARYPACASLRPRALLRDFWQTNRLLWRDREGGLSLAVTTIFWGVGATLQFAVLRWAADVLGLTLDRAALLQAAVAVGVVVGAGIAGRWVPLARAKQMLVFGVLLGLLIPVVGMSRQLLFTLPLLVLVGVVGGLLVVPLNALLQHRGFCLLSAGRSIAVQGFNENASVLAMLAVYAALLAMDVPITAMMWGWGLAIAAAMLGLMARERSRKRVRPPSAASSPGAGPEAPERAA